MIRSRLLEYATIAAVLFGGGAALADGTMAARTLSEADKARLVRFDASRAKAVAEAQAGGEAADLATLETVLSGSPMKIRGEDIRGDYRCRTIKLGGTLPLTIYGWFRCRIDEDDLGYRLIKTSGSQRLSGHFIDDSETRLTFYGAGHYGGEKPRNYDADPDRDMVGYLVQTGPERMRLELPLPKYESTFDIIELERK